MELAKDKILAYYRENYEMSLDEEAFGVTVPHLAKRSDRQETTILGFRLGKTPTYGPEACEYTFLFSHGTVTRDILERTEALLEQAEKAYVNPGPEHAFTFLSAIFFAGGIAEDAAARLKKFKLSHDYRANGFSIARIAVLCENGDCLCNKDGKDLKNLLMKLIR